MEPIPLSVEEGRIIVEDGRNAISAERVKAELVKMGASTLYTTTGLVKGKPRETRRQRQPTGWFGAGFDRMHRLR